MLSQLHVKSLLYSNLYSHMFLLVPMESFQRWKFLACLTETRWEDWELWRPCMSSYTIWGVQMQPGVMILYYIRGPLSFQIKSALWVYSFPTISRYHVFYLYDKPNCINLFRFSLSTASYQGRTAFQHTCTLYYKQGLDWIFGLSDYNQICPFL